jgi:hypothetical protein
MERDSDGGERVVGENYLGRELGWREKDNLRRVSVVRDGIENKKVERMDRGSEGIIWSIAHPPTPLKGG